MTNIAIQNLKTQLDDAIEEKKRVEKDTALARSEGRKAEGRR